MERRLGMPFFQVKHGGDAFCWPHLFWLFSAPEVYIIFCLPGRRLYPPSCPVMARTNAAWPTAG